MLTTLECVDTSAHLGELVGEHLVALDRGVAVDVDDALQSPRFGHLLAVQVPRNRARANGAEYCAAEGGG